MKKILFILFAFVTFAGFSQSKSLQATCDSKISIEKQKESGSFIFIFPSEINKDQIERTSKYYKNSFVVSSANKSNTVQIRMLVNNSENRMVIKRFLIGNRINKILYEGTSYSVDEFYNKYLN